MNPRNIGARCGALCALFLVLMAGWPIASSAQNTHSLPLVLPAGGAQTGFVRIANNSDQAGTVRITAIDDTGERYGPVSLALDGNEAVNLNSRNLEQGSASKGLPAGVGDGSGSWRLILETALNITPLAYIRTSDGFVTAMHDVAGATEAGAQRYRVMFFNPASNVRQVSRLRIINAGVAAATIEIAGRDDAGRAAPGGTVNVEIPAGGAHTLTAQALEAGGSTFSGRLGDGSGKWRLTVSSNVDIQVMNLLSTPTGHLANLSTVPGAAVATGPTDPTGPTVPTGPGEITIETLTLQGLINGHYRLSVRLRSSTGSWPIGGLIGCVQYRHSNFQTTALFDNPRYNCSLSNEQLRGWAVITNQVFMNIITHDGTHLSEIAHRDQSSRIYYFSPTDPVTYRVCIHNTPVDGVLLPPITCKTVSRRFARNVQADSEPEAVPVAVQAEE